MHVGHLVPFLFTAYLQRVFDAPCVIQVISFSPCQLSPRRLLKVIFFPFQLTDDEKFLYKGLPFEECERLVKSNTKASFS